MMKGKKLLKIVSNMITTILFIVLLSTLFLVIVSKTSGDEVNLFGYQIKTVLSGSMEPDIETGSVIAVKTDGDMTRFKTGDVITFRTDEDILITHRVVEVNGGGQQYITKGDANDGADLDPVIYENVVGEYTGFTVPYVGYVMNFAGTREGAALLLILPGVFFIGYSVFTIWRTVREVKRLIDKEGVSQE